MSFMVVVVDGSGGGVRQCFGRYCIEVIAKVVAEIEYLSSRRVGVDIYISCFGASSRIQITVCSVDTNRNTLKRTLPFDY